MWERYTPNGACQAKKSEDDVMPMPCQAAPPVCKRGSTKNNYAIVVGVLYAVSRVGWAAFSLSYNGNAFSMPMNFLKRNLFKDYANRTCTARVRGGGADMCMHELRGCVCLTYIRRVYDTRDYTLLHLEWRKRFARIMCERVRCADRSTTTTGVVFFSSSPQSTVCRPRLRCPRLNYVFIGMSGGQRAAEFRRETRCFCVCVCVCGIDVERLVIEM